MSRLTIRLLGNLELTFDGSPWRFAPPPRAIPLLGYLLLHVGETISRAWLAALLWPDEPDEEARANLRRHLYAITKGLPPAAGAPWVITTSTTVSWNAEADVQFDVHDFLACISDPQRFEEAAALYRGDLLPNVYDEWLFAERESLRAKYVNVCYDAALLARRDRNFDLALTYVSRILAVDEWREDAVRLGMAVRYDAGDRAAAISMFEAFAQRLHSEMRVEPMPETVALRDAILSNTSPGITFGDDDVLEPSRPKQPFVGRVDELGMLKAAWMRAARGRGTTVFVGGVPGIGKTALVSELAAIVEGEGGRALIGSASHPEAFPYEPIALALRRALPLIAQSPPDRKWLSVLSAILPELHAHFADLPTSEALQGDASRFRLLESIARAIEQLARARPLVLILEDLHWAAASTIEVLEHLARRIGAAPMLLIATYRKDETHASHPLSSLRRRLHSEHRSSSLTVSAMSQAQITELIERIAGVSDAIDLAPRVVSLSEGNPLFALQLVKNYLETGVIPDGPSAASTIGSIVLSRFDSLSLAQRAVCEAAAILGQTFTVEAVARVLGWDENDVADAFGVLLDRALVREAASAQFSYMFAHALIAGSIYGIIPETQRKIRHRRVAQVLESSDTSELSQLAAIAHHWAQSGDRERAFEARERAAIAAIDVFARAEAIEFAQAALQDAQSVADRFRILLFLSRAKMGFAQPARWRAVLDELTRLAEGLGSEERYLACEQEFFYCLQLGDYETMSAAALRLRTFAESAGSAARQARSLLYSAMAELRLGNLYTAVAFLGSSLEQDSDGPDATETRMHLVRALLRLGDREKATSELERVRRDPWTETLRGRIALASLEIAVALASTNMERLMVASRELLSAAEESSDLDSQMRAHQHCAVAAEHFNDLELAQEHFAKSREIAERMGNTRALGVLSINAGSTELEFGRLQEARELLRRGRELSIECGDNTSLLYALNNSSEVECGLGNIDEAHRFALEAITLADECGDVRGRAGALLALGRAQCARGDLTSGIEQLRSSVRLYLQNDILIGVEHAASTLVEWCDDSIDAGITKETARILEQLYGGEPAGVGHRPRLCLSLARLARLHGDEAAATRYIVHGRALLATLLSGVKDESVTELIRALPFSRALENWILQTQGSLAAG